MKQDRNAYCDFNEHGYCKVCGDTRNSQPDPQQLIKDFHFNGKWPANTWFQQRRLQLAVRDASKGNT